MFERPNINYEKLKEDNEQNFKIVRKKKKRRS